VLLLLALNVVLLSRSKMPLLSLLPPPPLSGLLPLLLWLSPLHLLVLLPSQEPIPLSLPLLLLLLALLLLMSLLPLLKKSHRYHRLSALAPIEIRRRHRHHVLGS
jgi:hypothetical protein